MEDQSRRLKAAIRETLLAGDRVTPDVGGSGTTGSMADAIIERL
jgi:isocitrate dehydrogenase (NAD+)